MENKNRPYPPGPRRLPGIGNMHNIKPDILHESLWDHKEKYGDISSFVLFGQTFVALNTIDVIREALESGETAKELADRPMTFFRQFALGGGIALTSYNETWRVLRGATHSFMRSVNDMWFDVVLGEEITSIIDTYKSASTPIHMLKSIERFASNAMSIFLKGEAFVEDHNFHNIVKAYVNNSTILFRPKHMSILTKFPFLRLLPFPYGRTYDAMLDAKDKMVQYILHDVRNENRDCSDLRCGFLFSIIEAQTKNSEITDERIQNVIQDLFTAGFPAMTATLLSLVYQLLHHPDVQDKISAEIDAVVGADGQIRLSDQHNFPYTQAVMLESMRLAAIAPGSVPRTNSEDVTIRGYHIEQGTVFVTNAWRVHHDSEVYDEPWAFKPQRFLAQDGTLHPLSHPTRRSLVPFGVGIRRCVGEMLACSCMFLYTTALCRTFVLASPDNSSAFEPQQYRRDILMYPPMYTVTLTPRPPSY